MEPPQVYGSKPIEIAWTAAPALVVFVLVLVTARTLWEVNVPPPQPRERRQHAVRHGGRPPVVVGIHLRPLQRPGAGLHDGQRTAHPGRREGRTPACLPDPEVRGRVPQLLGAPAGAARPT